MCGSQIKKLRHGIYMLFAIIPMLIFPALSYAFVYTIKSKVRLRTGPGINYPVVTTLPHNQTLSYSGQKDGWMNVKTTSGVTGFVRKDMVSDLWIKVHKKERRLYLMKGSNNVVRQYPVALSSFNPDTDKSMIGDGGTPEGRFFICEMIKNPGKSKYGARSIRISYPSIEDARRGLKDNIITMRQYFSIVRSIHEKKMPDQTTGLGGSIRIHGGGSDHDWTLGCIALNDTDIIELYKNVYGGYRIEIYASADSDQMVNRAGYVNEIILQGAEKQLKTPALYTQQATKINSLPYPEGDITGNEAVCTDIVIRSLRYAGLDLQALVHEDAIMNPEAYLPDIQKANYNIDHRRVRTLKRFFDRHAIDVSGIPEEVQPGDIVIMDTGVQNGTRFDHIGIVSNQKDGKGHYTVINIWTIGERTAALSLIGREYPEVVCYYRMTHFFDYDAGPTALY